MNNVKFNEEKGKKRDKKTFEQKEEDEIRENRRNLSESGEFIGIIGFWQFCKKRTVQYWHMDFSLANANLRYHY